MRPRWAKGPDSRLDTLLATPLPGHSAVVVRLLSTNRDFRSLPPEWLIVSETGNAGTIENSHCTPSSRMHELQAQLKRADALLWGQRPATQGVEASPSTSPSDPSGIASTEEYFAHSWATHERRNYCRVHAAGE